ANDLFQTQSPPKTTFRGHLGAQGPTCDIHGLAKSSTGILGLRYKVLLPATHTAPGECHLIVGNRGNPQPDTPYPVSGHGDPKEPQRENAEALSPGPAQCVRRDFHQRETEVDCHQGGNCECRSKRQPTRHAPARQQWNPSW